MTRPAGSTETHERILTSALVVFSEKGYFDATVKDIADKAGCNTVTVFRHFESKEELFKAVIENDHEFDFDPEDLESKLSYINLHNDFRLMADYFFATIYKNIHKLRIYINDIQNFDFINKYAWFIPDSMKSFVADYIITMYPENVKPQEASLIAEMFVCYIIRTGLRPNVHEGIEENSKELAKDARQIMSVSVDMTVDMIRLTIEKSKEK